MLQNRSVHQLIFHTVCVFLITRKVYLTLFVVAVVGTKKKVGVSAHVFIFVYTLSNVP